MDLASLVSDATPAMAALVLLGASLHTYLYMLAERASLPGEPPRLSTVAGFSRAWESAGNTDRGSTDHIGTGINARGPVKTKLGGRHWSHLISACAIGNFVTLAYVTGDMGWLFFLLFMLLSRLVVAVLQHPGLTRVAFALFHAHWGTGPLLSAALWIPIAHQSS